ncbi:MULTISPECIES: restriction endonuclease subunit S [unclassified Staphylococcus]|uniref:restriction endonuclease subunit S n=1 Tax=unclassified Staphylococcus TaxID=91994 RepID=UPI001AEBBBAE|nr:MULTISPECIES: restriction endonuclease subunit S [unclassified Staphylococcus]
MEYKLGKVSTFYDSLHKTPKNYNIYGYPMVRVKDISTGFLDLSSCFNVSEDDYLEFSKKYKPQSGDIIITRVGTYGNIALVTNDKRFCLGQNTVILNVDKKIIDNKYLFYYLTSSMGQQQIESKVTGSTQKTISLKSLKEINIIRHDYYKEKQIGNLLYKIDNKINNNKQIIANLEELSQTLFKRWFVDFEFPDENGNPYKSSGGKMFNSELGEIPEGWKVQEAKDIYSITIGKTPPRKLTELFSQKEGTDWVSISDMKGEGMYINHAKEKIVEEGIVNHKVKVVPKGSVLLSFKLTIGRVKITNKELTTNEAIAHFVSDNMNQLYTYLYLKNFNFENLGNTSSIATAINSKIVKKMPILVPNQRILTKFINRVEPFMKSIDILQCENIQLIQLRDTLLPKLMAGEIEIPDDIEVNEDELSI